MTLSSYIMIGGFLGAGKTTAMLRLAEHLTARGVRVGLITNDQSRGLVDTTLVAAHEYPVEEITGGCFCCRFNSLTDAADRLARDARPEVFLAEPVGSCTDLRATVQYPLRRMYGDRYRIAPLSVLVDPHRAARVLGLEPGRTFSSKVVYVYEKQLEEADIIVINKSDTITPGQAETLRAALCERYAAAEVVTVSARSGAHLADWFDRVTEGTLAAKPAVDVDYDVYAEGEALLGWLNATVHLTAAAPFDGNRFVEDLAGRIHAVILRDGCEIGHLKMTLVPEEGSDIAAINLVRNGEQPEASHRLIDDMAEGELIVNLRAEGDPARLRAIVQSALGGVAGQHGATASVIHAEHFRPARPEPTYRLAAI